MSADILLFRRRPATIQARRLNAEDWETCEDIARWCGGQLVDIDVYLSEGDPGVLWINTLEGHMLAEDGDWIVMGAGGKFHPVKPADFEAAYEPVVAL